MAESEDKGYTVKDRRHHQMNDEEQDKTREEGAAPKPETGSAQAAYDAKAAESARAAEAAGEMPLPEVSFSSFLFSLASSAFVHLGAFPDPNSGEIRKDLSLAKQTIDLLGMLREKTKGNLSAEEENLFDPLLYDLRMKYIKEAG
jgi:hypothetical protein